MRKEYWLTGLLFLMIAAVFVFSPGQLIEPDQFYHIKHAEIYGSSGIFETDFPWTQFSVWKIHRADIWYGFHLLLIPFTVFSDLGFAAQLAAVTLTSLALFIFYLVLRRHSIRYPVFWTLLFYFATPNLLFRFNQLRPNTITLILLALILSFLIKPAGKRPWLMPMIFSFLLTFFHLTFFWAPLLVTAVVLTERFFRERRCEWRTPLAVIGGVLLGWLARPNPFGAWKILSVQLFDLFSAKLAGVPILSGDELQPANLSMILNQLVPLLIVWLMIIGLALWKRPPLPVGFWSGLALSATFFLLAFTMGRRATDIWALAVIFLAAICLNHWRSDIIPNPGLWAAILLVTVSIWHTSIYASYAKEPAGGSDQLKATSLWLRDNTQPGEIVFHTSWDDFPMLFFWNDQNYYINGADPIFEYAYDEKLYYEHLFLALGGKPYTCSSLPCAKDNGVDLHTAISRDFRAKYVLLRLDRNAGLANNLSQNPGFEKIFSTANGVIYLVR